MQRQRGQRKWLFLLFLLCLMVLIFGSPFTGFAQDTTATTATLANAAASQGADTLPASEALVPSQTVIDVAVALPDGRIKVIVELAQPAAFQAFVQAGGALGSANADAVAQAAQVAVEASQQAFTAGLASAGIHAEVAEATSFVLNSLTLYISPDQLNALRAQPNVVNVYPAVRMERELGGSVQTIGAPAAWAGDYGSPFLGEGVVIAIIDSGVDISHRGFNGSGTWPTDPAVRASAPMDANFGPGQKIVGGWDYVGDAYNGGNNEGTGLPLVFVPSPDPNPIDCTIDPADLVPTFGVNTGVAPVGHGTHVAGIAAGLGVNSDGTTYTGDYTSVPFGTMRVAPGVAPKAQILALRVFGCYGSTDSANAIAAIDDAVSGVRGARADVINMSLGSGFGYGGDDGTLAPYLTAINNATMSGTLVVTSAGNNYDTAFATSSPGSTVAALSTAATDDGYENGIMISGTTADGLYGARNSVVTPPITVNGPYPIAKPLSTGCEPTDYVGFPENTVALVLFVGAPAPGCGSIGIYSAAAKAASTAGANAPVGLLVISNTPTGYQNLSCGPDATVPVDAPRVQCVSIEASLGELLEDNIDTAQVSFDPSLIGYSSSLVDTVAVFSSRGPSRHNSISFKPDVAAPGAAIFSVGSGLGSFGQTMGGTSMASPHVAGFAAMLLSNPTYANWTPTQIKALIMNTANNDVFLDSNPGPRLGPQRVGTGRIDIEDAMNNRVIAFNRLRPDAVSVSFGDPEVVPGAGPATFFRDVRVQNWSNTAVTYDLSIDTYTDNNISAFSIQGPTTITVNPLSSVDVTVKLTVNAPTSGTAPANQGDESTTLTQSTGFGAATPRHYLSEEAALLKLTPTAGSTVPLRVPLYAAPRAVSNMRAAANPFVLDGPAAGSALLPLTGNGVFTSNTGFPEHIVSSVTALRLMDVDPIGDTLIEDDLGLIPGSFPELDLQYTGIATNFNRPGGNTNGSVNANTRVFVGLSTAGDWATPNEYFFEVYIDANQDGFGFGPDDFVIFTSAPTITGTTSRADVFVSYAALNSVGLGSAQNWVNAVSAGFNTYLLNNNVAVIQFNPGVLINYDNNPATPATPMLGAGDTTFNFYVATFSRVWGYVDVSDVMSFDLANPMIDTHAAPVPVTSVPMWDDVPGNQIPFNYNMANYPVSDDTPPALLLLHHHNAQNVQSANSQNFRRAEVVNLEFDRADLGFTTATLNPSVLTAGSEFDLTLNAVNYSAATSSSADIVLNLPAGVSYVSAPASCTHEPVGGTVTCALGVLNSLDAASVTMRYRVADGFAGSFTITANLLSSVMDADPSDNTATISVSVPLPAATPIAPVGSITETSPTFSWSDVAGASQYQLWVSNAAGTMLLNELYTDAASCNGTDCEVTPPLSLTSGSYSWWVRPWSAVAGYGSWTSESIFSVAIAPGPVTATAPVGVTNNPTPSFQWNTVPGATWYQLWVTDVSGAAPVQLLQNWYQALDVCSAGACAVTPELLTLNSGGAYRWWVRSWNAEGGYGDWNTQTDFSVASAPAGTIGLSPVGTVNTGAPIFTWNAQPQATRYLLLIADANGAAVHQQWFDQAAVCSGAVCNAVAGIALGDGLYHWYVRAANEVGESPWSAAVDLAVETSVQTAPRAGEVPVTGETPIEDVVPSEGGLMSEFPPENGG
jgi:subtilisin family serine protease